MQLQKTISILHISSLKVVISMCAIRTFWVYFLLSARTDPCLQSIQLCGGGSLLCQTSPLAGYRSCTGGSGQCGWASCTHTGGLFIYFNMHFEERDWSLGLLLNGELDFCTLTIQMLEGTLQLPVTMFPDDRSVIPVVQLQQGLQWGCCQCLLLKVLHVTVDVGLNW